MKKALLTLLATVPLMAGAQKIEIGGGELPPIEPIEKSVYDSAKVKVYYDYAYRKDSTDMEKWNKGQAILLVGDRYTGCTDYYQAKEEALNDTLYYEKRPPMELLTKGMELLRNVQYKYPLVIDNEKNVAHVQMKGITTVEYKQQLEPLAWTLAEGDSVIAGVKCKKATCNMGGREWVAWYSEEYNMPYGPYLFRGLPGLIFAVSDTRNNHVFTLNGLETLTKPEVIYLVANKNILKVSRKDAFKAQRNEADDPLGAFKMTGATIAVPEGKKTQKRPYNPIELE